MNWYSVQVNAAIIAGLVFSSVSLIIALAAIVLTIRKGRQNWRLVSMGSAKSAVGSGEDYKKQTVDDFGRIYEFLFQRQTD